MTPRRGTSLVRHRAAIGALGRSRGASAFTLIEMVMSMALLSLILGAMTAVVTLAARSAPNPSDLMAQQISLQALANQIMLDAGDASEVELVGKHELRIVCDDLNGDADADTIIYAWSGVAGEPLTRAFNGHSRVVVEHIEGLAFSARGVLLSSDGPLASITRTNQTLARVPHLGASGAVFNVRTSAIAQRFKPRVPGSATTWALSGVSLWLQRDGLAESQGVVQILSDVNGAPGAVLAQRTFAEISLSASLTKQTFPFTLPGLDPKAAYWIVVRASLLTSPCGVLESGESIACDHEILARWDTTNSMWSMSTDKSLVFEVQGSVTLPQPRIMVESRATALFVNLSTERTTTASGVRLGHRPLLSVRDGAVVDVGASQNLLDSVGESIGTIVDATGGLLGDLLGGGSK